MTTNVPMSSKRSLLLLLSLIISNGLYLEQVVVTTCLNSLVLHEAWVHVPDGYQHRVYQTGHNTVVYEVICSRLVCLMSRPTDGNFIQIQRFLFQTPVE